MQSILRGQKQPARMVETPIFAFAA